MRAWFYSLADGTFTGDSYAGPDLQANMPAGYAAIEGVADWQAQRVDLETGALVDWQPPAPSDDAMRTWGWDAQARRWQPTPTTAAIAAEVRAERDQRLAACDWVSLRALDLGQPVPQAWAAYRAALRAVPDQPGFPRLVAWPDPPP